MLKKILKKIYNIIKLFNDILLIIINNIMIFRTYEHYYENENEYKFKNIDCFICFENILCYDFLNLNNNYNNYNKRCNCNGYIHQKCLDKWYLMTKSCPICRKPIIKNNNLFNDFLKNKQLIINKLTNNKLFFFITYIVIKIITFIQIFVFFLFIYNFILYCLIYNQLHAL
jgi:hypothetical protein